MAKTARLPHFRRALRYIWPQRKRLITAMVCALGMALAYTGTIGGVLPVLKLLIADEGPRTAAFRYIAGQRLRASLGDFQPARGGFRTVPPEHALIVRTMDIGSPLAEAGVEPGDALFPQDPVAAASDSLKMLVQAPSDKPTELLTLSPVDSQPRPIRMELGTTPRHLEWAGSLVALLPADVTPAGRINTLIALLAIILVISLFGNVCRFWSQYLVHLASVRSIMD
ncbi:MAG: hypothetical protein JSU68_06960, partial [Phycisphaerales bacterium]